MDAAALLLVEQRANVEIKDSSSNTPLQVVLEGCGDISEVFPRALLMTRSRAERGEDTLRWSSSTSGYKGREGSDKG